MWRNPYGDQQPTAAMKTFVFKTTIDAVVRVQAAGASESVCSSVSVKADNEGSAIEACSDRLPYRSPQQTLFGASFDYRDGHG
jgi:hypothetical protein